MARRWGVVASGIFAGIVLFAVLIIIFTPAGVLRGALEKYLKGEGCALRAARFSKAFPLGLTARQVDIADARGVLFKADEATVRLEIMPLLVGRIGCRFDARIGGGSIKGDFSPGEEGELNFEAGRVRLEEVPFFATVTGAGVRGDLQAEGSFMGRGAGATGKSRIEIRGLELSGVKIGGLPLPDAAYHTVRGALKVEGGKAVLESLALQGEGIYVRLRGGFPVTAPLGAAPLNLTLEIMPKPDFMERQKPVFLLLSRYMASPGVYLLPVRGTLSTPVIQ